MYVHFVRTPTAPHYSYAKVRVYIMVAKFSVIETMQKIVMQVLRYTFEFLGCKIIDKTKLVHVNYFGKTKLLGFGQKSWLCKLHNCNLHYAVFGGKTTYVCYMGEKLKYVYFYACAMEIAFALVSNICILYLNNKAISLIAIQIMTKNQHNKVFIDFFLVSPLTKVD